MKIATLIVIGFIIALCNLHAIGCFEKHVDPDNIVGKYPCEFSLKEKSDDCHKIYFVNSENTINEEIFHFLNNDNIDEIILEVSIKDNPDYCWLLEPIEMHIHVINTADRWVNLTIYGYQNYDYIVKNVGGLEIYRWSDEYSWSGDEKIICFPPNSQMDLHTKWWQKGHKYGSIPYHPVRPGIYNITVLFPTKEKCFQTNFTVNVLGWYQYFAW